MAKKLLACICCIALVGGFFCFGSAAPNAYALEQEQKYATAVIDVSPDSARTGDLITVKVAVKQVEDLFGIQFALAYDADKVEPYGDFATFSEDYNYIRDEEKAPESGVTPIYPLIRKNVNDTGAKAEIVLAEFTFKAVKTGTAIFKLQHLKGVSSETFINEQKREDVKQIPISNEEASAAVTIIRGGGSGGSPSSGSSDTSATTPALDNIGNETDPAKAAEQLLNFLNGSVINEENREAVEKMTQQVLDQLLTVTSGEKTEVNGQSCVTLNVEEMLKNIDLAAELLETARKNGLSPQAPMRVGIKAEGSEDVWLPEKALQALHEKGLDVSVEKAGVQLLLPVEAIYGEASGDVREDAGVLIVIRKNDEQPEAESGPNGPYKSGAEYTIEAFRVVGDRIEAIVSFESEVVLTVKYDPQGLDIEKVGLYYFNEETGSWEYIRGARHDSEQHAFTVALSHFSRYAVMEYSRTFADLDGVYAQAVRAIEVLAAHHLVQGVDSGHFAPMREMTRAEFVSMLSRLMDWELVPYSGTFRDVQSGDWYADVAETAHRLGVAQGYNSQFHPNDPITREEMVAMLMRAYPADTTAESGSAELFADDASISDWAKEAVYWAKSAGLVKGVGDNQFAPKANTRRADMAVLFYNVMKSLGDR